MNRKESLQVVSSLTSALQSATQAFNHNGSTVFIGPLTIKLTFCDKRIHFYRWFFDATVNFDLAPHKHAGGHELIGLTSKGLLKITMQGKDFHMESPGQSFRIDPFESHKISFDKEAGPFDGWMVIVPPSNEDFPACSERTCDLESCKILQHSSWIEGS